VRQYWRSINCKAEIRDWNISPTWRSTDSGISTPASNCRPNSPTSRLNSPVAIKHSRLPADEQIIYPVFVKALEKVCDHARPSCPAGGNASASSGATARVESAAAIRLLCEAKPLHAVSRKPLRHRNDHTSLSL
jgi:hypothetical protein